MFRKEPVFRKAENGAKDRMRFLKVPWLYRRRGETIVLWIHWVSRCDTNAADAV